MESINFMRVKISYIFVTILFVGLSGFSMPLFTGTLHNVTGVAYSSNTGDIYFNNLGDLM